MKLKWKCPECGGDQLSIYSTVASVSLVEGYDEEKGSIIASESDPGNNSEVLECYDCGYLLAYGDDDDLEEIIKALCGEEDEED